MSLQTDGITQLKLKLQRVGLMTDVANEELKRCAEEVADLARNMAPIDYGDLKAAIQVARRGAQGEGGRFVKGVSNYEVFINDRHPVSDPEKIKHGVSNVGEYAWFVHEHMGWESQPNPNFMPSAESIAEGRRHGVEAGGKFLERAGETLRENIHRRLMQVVFRYLEVLDSE